MLLMRMVQTGGKSLSDLHRHDPAKGKADKRVRFTGIDLCGQSARISPERLFRFGCDPVDITGLESFRQADMGKKAIVCADPGDKVRFHVIPIFRRIRRRRNKVTKKRDRMGYRSLGEPGIVYIWI